MALHCRDHCIGFHEFDVEIYQLINSHDFLKKPSHLLAHVLGFGAFPHYGMHYVWENLAPLQNLHRLGENLSHVYQLSINIPQALVTQLPATWSLKYCLWLLKYEEVIYPAGSSYWDNKWSVFMKCATLATHHYSPELQALHSSLVSVPGPEL